jgi:hypothetical protein
MITDLLSPSHNTETRPAARLYHVRRARPSDHPAFCYGSVNVNGCLTIFRLIDSAIMVIAIPQIGKFAPWKDTDQWCGDTWRHYSRCGNAAIGELRKGVAP